MIAQIVLCYDIMSSKYQIIQFAINLPPLSPNPGLKHYQTFASFFDDPFLFSLLGVADFKLFENSQIWFLYHNHLHFNSCYVIIESAWRWYILTLWKFNFLFEPTSAQNDQRIPFQLKFLLCSCWTHNICAHNSSWERVI